MSPQAWSTLAWVIPVGLIVLGGLMALFALLVDGARRDRWQSAIYAEELARRAMARALAPKPHDPSIQRRIDKWS